MKSFESLVAENAELLRTTARVVARLRDFLKENLVDFEYYAPGGSE